MDRLGLPIRLCMYACITDISDTAESKFFVDTLVYLNYTHFIDYTVTLGVLTSNT